MTASLHPPQPDPAASPPPAGGSAPVASARRSRPSPLALAHRPLPQPPELARQGPLREGSFTSPLHNRYNAAFLGYALGWCFLVCFVTGYLSHEVQQPASWLPWPASPSWLYRATQGTHVITGLACIPLLLAKLWTVYPSFWQWPPARTLAHALERASLLLLVGGSLLQVTSGLSNVYQWYWFHFFFTPTHYYTSYVVMGALLVHIGTKIALARDALSHPERYGNRRRGLGAREVARRSRVVVPVAEQAPAPPVHVPAQPATGRPTDDRASIRTATSPEWFAVVPTGDSPRDPATQADPGSTAPAHGQRS